MKIDARFRRMATVGLIIGGLTLMACDGQKKPGGALAGPPEVAVMTVKAQKVAITTELPGRTSAFLVAEVRPQVGGIIQKRLFEEGRDVKAGQVLFRIDPAPFQASLNNAKAALGRSEANLSPILLKTERLRELLADKAVSQQEYDDASASLKQTESDIQFWKAMVETARINLQYTSVTAPISGRIGRSSVTEGALVTAQQPTPLATIQQLDPVYVDLTQSSANLLRLRKNMASGQLRQGGPNQAKVKLLLEDGTPYPQPGTLKFSDVTVDPNTGSVILRTVFPNPRHDLLPGMYVRAILEEGVNDRAILVPQRGVTRDPKGNPVAMVVNEADKVEQRTLRIDRVFGDDWLVGEGLKSGDRLIMEGIQKIKPGASVKAVPWDATSALTPPTMAMPSGQVPDK